MTTTYSPAQTAQLLVATMDTSTASPVASSTPIPGAALFRFALTTGTMFSQPVYFNATLSSVSGTEEFYILVAADGSDYSTLSNGDFTAAQIPSAYSSIYGTADSYELARESISTSGAQVIELDAAILAEFMATAQRYTDPWNGSLLLWLCASQNSLGGWTSATLSAYNAIDYSNRDTGGPGIKSSRYSRCPVTGRLIPRGEMVLDGYRGILVHPDAYDPPEPEPMDWTDIPEPNEDL